MNAMIIAVIVLGMTFTVLFFYGHRVLKIRQKQLEEIGRAEHEEVREISYVSYHGGLPELPKPQKLALALSNGNLFFITNKGERAKLPMDNCLKIEKFSTLRKHDVKRRSMVLWGPFNNIMFKDHIRHFIAINYRDGRSGSSDNNVLIEHADQDQRDVIFEEISESWKNYRHSAPGRNQGKAAVPEAPATS
ncbi:MAG: hypothetical protein ACE14T_01775 [Syntrophales bacterium]